jgi:hypothetical protein
MNGDILSTAMRLSLTNLLYQMPNGDVDQATEGLPKEGELVD